jgi:hypothetical protein
LYECVEAREDEFPLCWEAMTGEQCIVGDAVISGPDVEVGRSQAVALLRVLVVTHAQACEALAPS